MYKGGVEQGMSTEETAVRDRRQTSDHAGRASREGVNRDRVLIFDLRSDFLVNMSASADVLAMAKVEVDLSAIPEGKNVSGTIHRHGSAGESEY